MGQYQQWLLCQETDQSLRRKLEALEAERAALLERLGQLERVQPRPENQLVRLLLSALEEEGQQQGQQARVNLSPPSPPPSSSGARAWPRHHTSEVTGSLGPAPAPTPAPAPVPAPAPTQAPLPAAGPEQRGGGLSAPHQESLAQLGWPVKLQELELPEWLHRLTVSSGKDRRPGPIDEERIRTNRLVQRWLERWGRISPSPSSSHSSALGEGPAQE
ncbi:hypothetical protein [Thermogemmatispora onikobensis]|uniref:hypothetical protein n=1 Tax=Thermogemmatispora onikobensis TaxID=732234 RepID=UPI000853067B|nr:hypothetical protein [Thermogemmatispora onikobensis]